MPTPLQILLDPITLTVIAIYGVLIVCEAFFPARRLPHIPYWRSRALGVFFVYLMMSTYLPWLWADWLAPLRLIDLTALPTWAATATGVLVYEAGAWAWHRSLHGSQTLWRFFHQWHHSAERLDTFGAFWFSPLDIVGWTALSSVCLTVIVGLAPEAVVLVTYIVTFLAVFQHTNIRTPRWLGYIVQRPESHSWHHARGVHAQNYSDLPIFDLLLGTFRNPRDFAPEQGFHPGGSSRLLEMLRGRDISLPKQGERTAFHDALAPMSPSDV
ncbi:MAG: sterol desaturase family protein [Steroidobacteraceae bacterium]|nr:sterol desaturase family protein [Steroidobacteraceae bacterium]